ncbi:MAG: hypothetical protein Q8903_10180 [Bacteroidota bacterium]|nr:hypothetical protein [Bacteroidota bacterium]
MMLENIQERIERDPITGRTKRATRIINRLSPRIDVLYFIASSYSKGEQKRNAKEFKEMRMLIRQGVRGIRVYPFDNGINLLHQYRDVGFGDLLDIKQKLLERVQNASSTQELDKLNMRLDKLDKYFEYERRPRVGLEC